MQVYTKIIVYSLTTAGRGEIRHACKSELHSLACTLVVHFVHCKNGGDYLEHCVLGQLLWERLEFYFAMILNAFFIFSPTQLCVLRPFTMMKSKKIKTRLKLLQNEIPNAPIRVRLSGDMMCVCVCVCVL